MASGIVRVKMRPMHPVMLASILGLCLIPPSLGEPRLAFLPPESVDVLSTAIGIEDVYCWRGRFFEELPMIEEEMREHGYRAHICLDPDRCSAEFSRADGTKVRISQGRWRKGEFRGVIDTRDSDHVTAEVEGRDLLGKCLAGWSARLKSYFSR